jgi:hypothetical protein
MPYLVIHIVPTKSKVIFLLSKYISVIFFLTKYNFLLLILIVRRSIRINGFLKKILVSYIKKALESAT